MQLDQQKIAIGHTLDVETIERELSILWKHSAAEQASDEFAVMRARVANLIIFTTHETELDETKGTLNDLSAAHPCRALVVIGERAGGDQDIELFVSSYSHRDTRGETRLCCEEVQLIARGIFVRELPSAALPLLIPDLPTFLWWRDRLEIADRVFLDFTKSSDRLVIDTAESKQAESTLTAVARIFTERHHEQLGVSDINWARLTSWRALLASFYDAEHCRAALTQITNVVIEYSAPQEDPSAVAPQALLLAGWLAGRLNWELPAERTQREDTVLRLVVSKGERRIQIELIRVERPDIKPGRLSRAVLVTKDPEATFMVARHEKGLHLETRATIAGTQQPGRVLPVRNRSTAQLLGRELEILCNDYIYAEAVRLAARMIDLYSK